MQNITAQKTENDGRQWFDVTFANDEFGQEAGVHAYAVCANGTLFALMARWLTPMDCQLITTNPSTPPFSALAGCKQRS